jgi:hypothetical protein
LGSLWLGTWWIRGDRPLGRRRSWVRFQLEIDTMMCRWWP